MKKFLNITINIISTLLVAGFYLCIYYFTGNSDKFYLILLFFAMLHGWLKYNNNKKSLIFYLGIIYITIPMLYWIITNKHHTMINIFIFLIGYNLFALLLFTITDGVFIKHNRNSLIL